MVNPHNIKVGQEVILLRIGHNKFPKSKQYDEVNVLTGTVTKIGRLYFTVGYDKSAYWNQTEDFCLDTLKQRSEEESWHRYRCFLDRQQIEQQRVKLQLYEIINIFLERYRYGLNNINNVSMTEVELWIEHIDKVGALKNGNRL